MTEAHRICSGDTSESRLSWSSGVQVELSKKMFSTLRASLPMPSCRPPEHAVVGRAVGRLAIGLVEREDVRAAHAGLVHEREMLRDGQRVPVLVEPEMRVRVEGLAVLGEQRGDVAGLCREQLLGTFD